jgi:tRNA uridine 5-carboxymethylaminomethyl modification enzyme
MVQADKEEYRKYMVNKTQNTENLTVIEFIDEIKKEVKGVQIDKGLKIATKSDNNRKIFK